MVLQFVEGEKLPGGIQKIASVVGIDKSEAMHAFGNLNKRIRSSISLKRDPFLISADGGIEVDWISGSAQLFHSVEVEVCPKFLDPDSTGWKEDFVVAALLSKTAHLMPRERLSARPTSATSIADLLAYAFCDYWDHASRVPFRQYSHFQTQSFVLRGEVNPVDILSPSTDGFTQNTIEFDHRNAVNARFLAACKALLGQRISTTYRNRLHYIAHRLAPQNIRVSSQKPRIDARNAAWRPLLELSDLVLESFGSKYGSGALVAPGFVLKSWQSWQHIIYLATRSAFPEYQAFEMPKVTYGSRWQDSFDVYPDVLMTNDDRSFVVDAKYKGKRGANTAVSNSDIYEILAFLGATNSTQGVLVYPENLPATETSPVGSTRLIDRISANGREILAVAVQITGLSTHGGFERFALSLGDTVRGFLGQEPTRQLDHLPDGSRVRTANDSAIR